MTRDDDKDTMIHITIIALYFLSAAISAGLLFVFWKHRDEGDIARLMIMNSLNIGIIIINKKNRIVGINPAAYTMLGLDGIDLTGQEVTRLQQYQPVLIPICALGTNTHQEISILVDDVAHYYNVEISAMEDERGEVDGRILTLTNITERKQAEDQFRQLSRAVDQSGSSIIITNLDGDIQFVNPAFSRITGFSIDEVIGENPRVLQSGLHEPVFYTEMWDTLTQGKVWQGEMVSRKKDDSLYWEHVTISPIK